MSEAPPRQPAAVAGTQMPIHTIWWHVLSPVEILKDGQPAQGIVGVYETLAAATAAVRLVPNGAIVQNVVVFVNPKTKAEPSGLIIGAPGGTARPK